MRGISHDPKPFEIPVLASSCRDEIEASDAGAMESTEGAIPEDYQPAVG
jgi:hypothetical protein